MMNKGLGARKSIMMMSRYQTIFIPGRFPMEKSIHGEASRLGIKVHTELVKALTRDDRVIHLVMVTKKSRDRWIFKSSRIVKD